MEMLEILTKLIAFASPIALGIWVLSKANGDLKDLVGDVRELKNLYLETRRELNEFREGNREYQQNEFKEVRSQITDLKVIIAGIANMKK